MVILETVHLGREVDTKKLVNDISIQVERGETLSIVGPSGAGKSSFLRLLNRLDEPTTGTLLLNGTDYKTISPRDLRRRIGMVLQAPYLFPGTVADNLRFGPLQQGKELEDTRLRHLLTQVGLDGYADRDISRLSGGEAQRVSLARTLANSPEVLLLDEPTSALDRTAEGEVEKLLGEIIAAEGLTCLIITHNPAQALRLSKRSMLLEAGQLVKIGPVEEIVHA
ncbi:MAG: phosphate ABC transporter ATP-binding protein [Chloroflexi bacterium]|nr:phosphate ABC transporter ATP-binding protein [Chloroflexota bacterium]OJV89512.1 MAG: choline transporter [Chloroflexi bacterium 54-19]